MLTLIFFYLILPFLLAWIAIRFLKKHPQDRTRKAVLAATAGDPLIPKSFRSLRIIGGPIGPGAAVTKLGDFETQMEAVDAIYSARAADGKAAAGVAYIVVNDQGYVLQEI